MALNFSTSASILSLSSSLNISIFHIDLLALFLLFEEEEEEEEGSFIDEDEVEVVHPPDLLFFFEDPVDGLRLFPFRLVVDEVRRDPLEVK